MFKDILWKINVSELCHFRNKVMHLIDISREITKYILLQITWIGL